MPARVLSAGYLLLLALILVVGAGVRLYHLSSVPTELIADELDLYNSAHSILTTGRDVDGGLSPFFYSAFTRNPPIYGYAAYLSSLVFGKNPFGLRFPAVLFGLTAIALIAALALELTRRRGIALVAALLMAVSPLFIHFARVGWEPASELPFLLGGLYVLLRALRADVKRPLGRAFSSTGLALAAVLLGLTCYTYMAGWFYALVLGGGMLALRAGWARTVGARLQIAAASLLWLLVSAPALWVWFHDPRPSRVATFAHGVTPAALGTFGVNYLKHFSWAFLVTTGAPIPGSTWRYLVGFGAFYWWVIPLVVLALCVTPEYVPVRWQRLWVYLWLIAYPFGGALTNEGIPNAPRTLAGAPVFCILGAIGCAALVDFSRFAAPWRVRDRVVLAGQALFLANCALSLALFCSFYFTRYVHQASTAWDSGTGALFAYLRANHQGYTRICFNLRPAWYAVDVYTAYYLSDVPVQTIRDVGVPQCWLRGTLIVTDVDHPTHLPGFVRLTEIFDVDGNGFAYVYGRLR